MSGATFKLLKTVSCCAYRSSFTAFSNALSRLAHTSKIKAKLRTIFELTIYFITTSCLLIDLSLYSSLSKIVHRSLTTCAQRGDELAQARGHYQSLLRLNIIRSYPSLAPPRSSAEGKPLVGCQCILSSFVKLLSFSRLATVNIFFSLFVI